MRRRDFLRTTALFAGGGAYAGKAHAWEDPTAPGKAPSDQKVAVGIARGSNMEEAVRHAVDLSGGLDFIAENQTVLIKPNCTGAAKNPTTTSPEVLYAVIKMVNERGPRKILVSDRCFSPMMIADPEKALTKPTTLSVMEAVGHIEAIEQAKSEFNAPVMAVGLEDAAAVWEDLGRPKDQKHWRSIKPDGAKHWPDGFELAELLFAVDHVINLPVIKTHFQAWYTMSMKAFVGMSHHRTRKEFHSTYKGGGSLLNQKAAGASRRRRGTAKDPKAEFDEAYPFVARVAELNLGFKPTLNILDGTESFVYGGPSSGDSVQPKLVVASRDRIAADATGIAVLKSFGTEERLMTRRPWETPFLYHGIKIGLGIDGPDKIDLKYHDVKEIETIQQMLA